ncbi:MAG: DNA repair exonuclease [Deltaproteobacteria bacterium]|nr:MAG: DNA repair exonuclease [Deltaproteobacteria bacterium]
MKFIHAADIHLDSPLRRLEAYEGMPVEEIRQASRRAFENLIDLALGESVAFVLIAGDLFDGDWKDYNTGLYFIRQVRRLDDAGIRLLIVSGNHDAAGQVTRMLPYPDNTHVFSAKKPETIIIDDLNVAIHGQSFLKPAVKDNLTRRYPEPVAGYLNIGLLHTSLTGREGHESYAPCTIEDLQNRGYDYWALGHVHQAEVICDTPPIVFPGCIQGRHIRESGIKGCVLVTVDDSASITHENRTLDVIRWEAVTVSLTGTSTEPECLARLEDTLDAAVRQHEPLPVITRIIFTGATKAHEQITGNPAHWKQVVRSSALARFGETVWIEKIKVKTRPMSTPAETGPMRELGQLVSDLKADDNALLDLGQELSTLLQKLPVEYRQGEDVLQIDDPARLRKIVDQAHAVLKSMLAKEAAADENP